MAKPLTAKLPARMRRAIPPMAPAGSGSQGFTGAVAEGGIESAGSNAVTLEQLKSGSLR